MISTQVLYSLDDVMIQPADFTTVRHRAEIETTHDNGFLPIFTSPMPCVVQYEDDTYLKYIDAKINPIIPRTTPLDTRIECIKNRNIFVAFSLDEFRQLFVDSPDNYFGIQLYVVVDMACGAMYELHNNIRRAKQIYGDKITIMSGNIASPGEFYELGNSGCDLIRCSVGTGSGCCTATYTGVYYPMASLIDECVKIKRMLPNEVKIIADGGITTYRNAFKALALGADYVMMGSRLCQCEDSAGVIKTDPLGHSRKIYYGMASVQGSKQLGKENDAPEGKVVEYPMLGSIAKFAHLFSKYLKSTMSYCDAHNLKEFIGKQTLNVISQSAQKQFNQN